jgi:cytochrome c-type biogenesis protein
MGEWFHDTAASGSLALALPVALVAGLVSFFSPCVIPLLPGYLSYATGLSGADLASGAAGERRGRMLLGSVLFVLGFSVVFVAIGSLSGALGAWLVTWRATLTVVLGVLTILLGLVFAGVFNRLLPGLQRDWRVHSVPAVGLAAAPLLGFLFGLGWTPCLGPTLAAITTLSLNEATAGRGALLSATYALGLGVPFVVAGLAYRRALGAFGFVRRHQAWVTRAGGLMLVLVGVLLVTGWWDQAVTWIQIHLISSSEVSV